MLEINISGQAEQRLTEIAQQNGQSVADFVGGFIEKKLANGELINGDESKNANESKTENEQCEETKSNPLMKMVGMFSSGKTDTSTRAREILRAEMGKNSLGDLEK